MRNTIDENRTDLYDNARQQQVHWGETRLIVIVVLLVMGGACRVRRLEKNLTLDFE